MRQPPTVTQLHPACEARGSVSARGSVARGSVARGSGGVVVAAHNTSKLTTGGCDSCSVVVCMLRSSISALNLLSNRLATRPEWRRAAQGWSGVRFSTLKLTWTRRGVRFSTRKSMWNAFPHSEMRSNTRKWGSKWKILKNFIFWFFNFPDRFYTNTTAPDRSFARGSGHGSCSTHFKTTPKVAAI